MATSIGLSVPHISLSIKEVLLETLTAALSSCHDVRVTAEQQLKSLDVMDEYGAYLAELTVDHDQSLSLRQLSSVLLKRYISNHWSSESNKFTEPETSPDVKRAMRNYLVMGLHESETKVRLSVAHAIATIAQTDWPECWPELFDILVANLKSENAYAVHGSMRVLTELIREISDLQIPYVAPIILPEMLTVLTRSEKYSTGTRGKAVEVFTTILPVVADASQVSPDMTRFLFPILPNFIEALLHSLNDKNPATNDNRLRANVLKALSVLIKEYPKHMVGCIHEILPIISSTITDCAEKYVRCCVNSMEEADESADSEGEVLSFDNLVYAIFDFVSALVSTHKFRSIVKQALEDLLYYCIVYMQLKEDQIDEWQLNTAQYALDEDSEESYSYSIRVCAKDIVTTLQDEFEQETAKGLVTAITKRIIEARELKQANEPNWWKIYEACLTIAGCASALVIKYAASGKIEFDIHSFLTTAVAESLNQTDNPFLVGRALTTSSKFAKCMNPEVLQLFVEATVRSLAANNPSVVRISALRAINCFCTELEGSANAQILHPFLMATAESLIPMVGQYPSEVLTLVMTAVNSLILIDKSFTAMIEPKISSLAIAVLLKYNTDPALSDLSQDIFKTLAQNEACLPSLVQKFLPAFISIASADTAANKIPSCLQAVAIDVMQSLVRASKPPLMDSLISQAFPAIAKCTMESDDNSVIQNGGECLRAFVSVSPNQVADWTDDQGNSGLHYVVRVAVHLLDPRSAESAAMFVGRLVTCLIAKLSNRLGDQLDLLLKAILSKLQSSETLSVIQNLVLVFAHLVRNKLDPVLEFLSCVPSPTGKTALEFVLSEWCSKQHLFFGAYDSKVSSVALCELLYHGVSTKDRRLTFIHVAGDPVMEECSGPRTRSKAAGRVNHWTSIPVLAKIFKLLLNELSNVLESKSGRTKHDSDGDENSDEDYESDEDSFKKDDASDGSGIFDMNTDDDDDPDIVQDSIYQLDLEVYLKDYLRNFVRQPFYVEGQFHSFLTEEEKDLTVRAGITTES